MSYLLREDGLRIYFQFLEISGFSNLPSKHKTFFGEKV